MKLLVVGLLALTLSVLLTVTLLAGYRQVCFAIHFACGLEHTQGA